VQIDGVHHWRTYSLTSPPEGSAGALSITVKSVADGRVSPHLAHRVTPGTLLRLGPAQGEFTLPEPLPRRMLMITAGSGLTPVMGMLRTLMSSATPRPRPDVVLLHSAPTAGDSLFREELREAQRDMDWLRYHEHHTRSGPLPGRRPERLGPAHLADLCPDWRERATWACGPAAMLDALEDHWAEEGLQDRLRTERFTIAPRLDPDAASTGGRVRFTRSGAEADAGASAPLLTVGEQAGVAMPYGCRRGICFGCLAPLSHGRVRDLRTGEVHGEPGQLIQTCVSAAEGQLALDL
jgi:ferredoxin-NADP reductase